MLVHILKVSWPFEVGDNDVQRFCYIEINIDTLPVDKSLLKTTTLPIKKLKVLTTTSNAFH